MRDLLERNGQVAVLVEIADDDFGNLAHRLVANGHAQLPVRWSRQPLRRRNEFLERRLLDDLVLAAALLAAAIEVLIEKRGDVEFVEGIGRLGLRYFFGLRLDEGLFAVILLGDRGLVGQLLEHRIGDHLLY